MNLAATAAVELAHRPLNLGVAGMADQHDVKPVSGIPGDFDMHLRDKRTGGIEHRQPTRLRISPDLLGHTMGRENAGGASRYLVHLIDKNRAGFAQAIDNEPVVHNFVADINRRAQLVESAFNNLDGAIDAGTKTTGIGKQDIHEYR